MSQADYNTLAVAAPQRFDYWKEVICRHCIPASSKALEDTPFDGQLRLQGLGPLDICSLSAPLHEWERRPSDLRTGPDDDLWLGFIEHGHGKLEQGGRKALLQVGSLVLYDAAQTFRFSLGGQHNHLTRIPRHLLSSRLPQVEQMTSTVLNEARPGVVPLREMLRQAATHPAALQSPEVAGRFSQTLLDLLVLSLELQDTQTTSVERNLYARAMNYILRHLAEPDLSVERIAQAQHVSPRTLTRAFARHQKTPMAVLWQARLQGSRKAIECGQARTVSQVALDFGFSDFSHFSHAFKKAFGVSPRSLLKR
ncbi:helix-turn-helix domain-containing protein [Pseudomonas syringae group genomosp. 3]|uniref:HTH araC/xylS-type domain-containing protein n=1 Tax=Pseudomonas syringae pv. viburni TaxID=251703 RepID=A0A0Q0CJ26_9PSED|nr:helix-turn-helix domain-containing protein [Pseudomonas syringae group genomosp. 3]KPZ08662.1 hypothetical protein ALO40_02962 [Pseudomonas syringae pv. viburni]